MSYLVIQLFDNPDDKEPINTISVKHPLNDPSMETVKTVCRQHGYEILSEIESPKKGEHKTWKLALVYTSRNKKGDGRCGSSLYRILYRPITKE